MTQGTQNQSFTWGNDLIAAKGDSPQDSFYYLQDHLGSPIRLLGEKAANTALAYNEFGMPTIDKPNISNPFGFTGYQTENIAGMYYAQARYYKPQVGRFISEDPIRDQLNWYGYCANNPLKFFDPLGLECEELNTGINSPLNHLKAFLDKVRGFFLANKGHFAAGAVGGLVSSNLDHITGFFTPGNILSLGSMGVSRLTPAVLRAIGATSNDWGQRSSNRPNFERFASAGIKITRTMPYVAVPLDIGIGVIQNINDDTNIVTGVLADTTIAGGYVGTTAVTHYAAKILLRSAWGGPGGAIVGYLVFDVVTIDGKTVREHTRDRYDLVIDWYNEGIRNANHEAQQRKQNLWERILQGRGFNLSW